MTNNLNPIKAATSSALMGTPANSPILGVDKFDPWVKYPQVDKVEVANSRGTGYHLRWRSCFHGFPIGGVFFKDTEPNQRDPACLRHPRVSCRSRSNQSSWGQTVKLSKFWYPQEKNEKKRNPWLKGYPHGHTTVTTGKQFDDLLYFALCQLPPAIYVQVCTPGTDSVHDPVCKCHYRRTLCIWLPVSYGGRNLDLESYPTSCLYHPRDAMHIFCQPFWYTLRDLWLELTPSSRQCPDASRTNCC